ncbi:MAG: hypothetical protein KC646_12940 [Candidatus Cloacimonetes bacterium]|nr:hypothetical protein [Candidatus Cloacimonadota bacterium]
MNFDPFSMQKKMFDEWEKSTAEYVDKVMRDPSFMKTISQNMGSTLDMQDAIKEQTNKVLKSMNVPTEDSLDGLYKTVHNLETRMLDFEEKIDDLSDMFKKLVEISESIQSEAKTSKAKPKAVKQATKKESPKKSK